MKKKLHGYLYLFTSSFEQTSIIVRVVEIQRKAVFKSKLEAKRMDRALRTKDEFSNFISEKRGRRQVLSSSFSCVVWTDQSMKVKHFVCV